MTDYERGKQDALSAFITWAQAMADATAEQARVWQNEQLRERANIYQSCADAARLLVASEPSGD